MSNTESDPKEPLEVWQQLPLRGVGFKKLVHFACSKDPEAVLSLSDGKELEIAIGDLDIVTDAALSIEMRRAGDSSYIATYSGSAIRIASVQVSYNSSRFADPTQARRFAADTDSWIADGYTGSLGYVVEARIELCSATAYVGQGPKRGQ